MNHRMSVVVSRGSQVQKTPQTGLAQSGPVISVMVVKITPISAEAAAKRSQRRSRLTR